MTGRPLPCRWLSLAFSLFLLGATVPAWAGPPQISIRDCICDPVHNNYGCYPTRWRRWPGAEHVETVIAPHPDQGLPLESLPSPSRVPQRPRTTAPGPMPEESEPPRRQPTPLGLPSMPDVRPGLPDALPPSTDDEALPPEMQQPRIPSREDLQQLPDDDAPQPPGSLTVPPDSRNPLQPPPDDSSYSLPRLESPASIGSSEPLRSVDRSSHISNEWRRAVREASSDPYETTPARAGSPELFEPVQNARPVAELPLPDNRSAHKSGTTQFDSRVRPAANWQTPAPTTNPAAASRPANAPPLRANPLR